ncbi:flagellar brake protein [Alteribacter aurantiacus]|uniref:flagellar brake protein n=1 Tax=Alteribacter aurantiacus TaxID=254410 RepID=UPI000478BFD3|nr:PilZ domain-containing protein [Alteribacter aurantiacus]
MVLVGETLFIEQESKRFRSKVTDVTEESISIQEISSSHIQKGKKVKCWYLGKDQAIYLFETIIQGKEATKVPSHILKRPLSSNVLRVQRRHYVRVDAMMDIVVYPTGEQEESFTTLSLDISGGGMKLVLPDNHTLKEDNEVRILVPLYFDQEEVEYCDLSARVVRVFFHDGIAKASLSFDNIAEKDRQKVIRYCYERQLMKRRKEKTLQIEN